MILALTLATIQPALVQVCRGSGAYIAPDRILTAHHVVANPDCIHGRVIVADKANDVAVIEASEIRTTWLSIACKPSKHALALNHTGWRSPMRWLGKDAFRGRAYPGTSGSPIVNADGEVFAIITRGPGWAMLNHFRNDAYGGMLGETGLCGSGAGAPGYIVGPSWR